MKPLVTALVDTYNHEKYIEQALESVLEQGLSPAELEIVVVDDGSTDGTASIVQKFLPRVKYLRKKNGGQASAFNAAFPEVNGQIVAILDGDDWWARGKLRTVVDHLEQNQEISAVSHAYFRFYEASNEMKVFGPPEATLLNLDTPEAALAASWGWEYLVMGALTVRRKVLERVMPIPEALVFSADSPIAVSAMAMGVRVLPQPLSYYRFHSNNQYVVDARDMAKMRRKCEMDVVMYELLHPLLIRLGVSPESVSMLLDPSWVKASRLSLRTFGGSRLKTLQAEMRYFRIAYKNPTIGYRLFKFLVMGPATLLLSPQQFYELRDWYARQNLGRFRDWFCKPEIQ